VSGDVAPDSMEEFISFSPLVFYVATWTEIHGS
jgi:hypothetical protein